MRRLIIIVVIGLLLCFVIGFGYQAYVSHHPDSVSMELRPPFAHEQGNCWIVALPDLDKWADSTEWLENSTLMVYENGRALGPAHSVHDSIRTIGEGRFSHFGKSLFFSTTDNSDPNQNGRQYSLKAYPPLVLPLLVRKIVYYFLGFVLAGGVIGLALMALFSHTRQIRIWLIIVASYQRYHNICALAEWCSTTPVVRQDRAYPDIFIIIIFFGQLLFIRS